MEPPILYDFERSICCQMVRLTLAEKGVTYELRPVDIRVRSNEQFQPWYVALNPRAVVPTWQVHARGDGVVTDTLRICEFIEANYDGPALLPHEPSAVEQVRRWMRDIMAPHYGVLLYAPTVDQHGRSETASARHEQLVALLEQTPAALHDLIRSRIDGNQRLQRLLADPNQTAGIVEGVHDLVRSMEPPLSRHAFLVGDSYTLADAFATAALARFEVHSHSDWWRDGALPAVDAYYRRMQARPSWTAARVYNVEGVYEE